MRYLPTNLPQHIIDKLPVEERRARGLRSTEEARQEHAKAAVKADERSEKELQQDISKYLRLRGIEFIQSRMDRRTSNKCGTPDFLFSIQRREWSPVHGEDYEHRAGIPIALEVKNTAGKCTPEQTAMHERMRINGWIVYVVRSLPEVKRILDTLQNR